jgi:hypothetical protein
MAVFNAADVTPKQASALFYVTLTKFLLFAKFAESIAYYHSGIIPKRGMQGKQSDLA